MKKLLFLLLTALAVTACNDDCDHNVNNSGESDIVGSWYEEEVNEDISFSSSGTFYDKYSNTKRASELEGIYELSQNGRKLTYTYNFMGQTQFTDWTVSNRTELSFTITSDKDGSHVLEKIVETYNMVDGQTQQISFSNNYPDYNVQLYTSKNERIASVSEEGLITANGEKGTTYIKVTTNKGNAWVKVIVGEECLDLWYDYISLIGKNYSQMTSVLGTPHQNDGELGFFYATEQHDVIQKMAVWLNSRTRTVDIINLTLKEGVPSEVVLTYLEKRFYKYKEIGKSIQFLNKNSIDNSIVMVEYNQETNGIIIESLDTYLNFWPDFTGIFGTDEEGVRKATNKMNMSFSFNSQSYSPYGSDYYTDDYGDYMNLFGFVFNKAGQMFEYWAYMKENVDRVFVASKIGEKYFYAEEEVVQGKLLVWYNKDKTIRVKLDITNNAVIYTDLTLEGLPKWPDYTSAFGMTLDEISATYGDLYYGILPMYYIVNPYIEYVYFYIDDNTGKTTAYQLKLNEGFDEKEIHEYLSSRYTFYKSDETNTMFAYCDGESRDVSDLQIIFNMESGTIIYYDIQAYESNNAPTRLINKGDFPMIERPTI